MSFGFGVGDFVAVAQLSWNLYRYCYQIARGAPGDFQLLLQEITTLSNSIKLLQEEAQDPDSILVRAGEDRVRMVKEMMSQVEVTLRELEKYAKKYEKLVDKNRSKGKRIWDKVSWSIETSDMDGLRSKLVYHNGVINMLLTSCGNSSLQRIESTTLKLEKGVNDIKGLIRRSTTDNSSADPLLSAPGDKIFTITLSSKLMKNAVGGRKWTAIGVDEWIQGGRWWLWKSQMNLYMTTSTSGTISKQGYADLIKASWILVDIINRHPQLSFIESSVQHEVQLLAETIKRELQNIDTLGLLRPSFEDLHTCDLSIWETQVKEPALQPGKATLKSGLAQTSYESWVTADEYVLFQRFGNYQPHRYAVSTPCIVLFLLHKKDAKARIVLRDQSWVTLATFIVGEINLYPAGKILEIEDQKIKLPTSEDAKHISAISEAAKQYLFYFNRNDNRLETLQALTLVVAIKNGYRDLVQILLGDKSNPDMEIIPSEEEFPLRLWRAAVTLASESIPRKPNGDEIYMSVLSWAVDGGHHTIIVPLLEGRNLFTQEEEALAWSCLKSAVCSGRLDLIKLIMSKEWPDTITKSLNLREALYLAARNRHRTLVKELLDMSIVDSQDSLPALSVFAGAGYEEIVTTLLEAGADVNSKEKGYNKGGRTALQAAAEGGHETIIIRLLKAGAYVNANPASNNGRTALQAAAGGGHQAIVEELLRVGANVNAGPAKVEGYTALQAAAGGGYQAIVEELLKAGADVNAEPAEFDGRTALQAAAEGGHQAIVEELLKAGADTNAKPANWRCTALQAAAGSGNQAIVEVLLQAGANINAKPAYKKGHTALQAAAGGGHQAIVEELLKAGADVNAEPAGDGGRTALQAAAEGGYQAIVKELLKAGADVNAKPAEYRGRTALQAAAGSGNQAMVEVLFQAGAYVNANPASNNGRTALQAAAEGGHQAILKKLLKAGANVNAEPAGDGGYTALQVAAGSGNQAIVEVLFQAGAYVNANPASNNGRTALQAAAEGGHQAILKKLLKAGADVNAEPAEFDGRTALQAAAEGGHQAIVKELLKAGANVNAEPAYINGHTALQAAVGGGHQAIIEELLKAGADVNTEDGRPTALQAAAEGGHQAIVKELLKAGADVNAEPSGYCRRTALQAAAEGGHQAIVKELLKAGANVNARPATLGGHTALQAAVRGAHQDIVKELLKAGADVNAKPTEPYGRTALQAAAEGGHQAIVKELLKAGADVNAEPSGDSGRTALQAAAGGGHQAIVEELLKAGANVNAKPAEDKGRTALQAAAEGEHQAIVKELLKAGADVNAKPAHEGRTALQAAAEGGHQAIVKELLKAGADVNAKPAEYDGRTALQAAAKGGHQAIVEELLKLGAMSMPNQQDIMGAQDSKQRSLRGTNASYTY